MDSTRTIPPGMTDPKKVTAEQAAQVAARLRLFMQRNKMGNAAVGRAVGKSPSVISQFVSGSYGGAIGQIAVDVDIWLGDEARRESAPQTTQFCWITVAREIQTVAEVAVRLKKIGLVYGDPGIGKTMALQAIAADKPNSVFVTCETMKPRAGALMEAIGLALGVTPDYARTGQRWYEAIVQRLRGSGRLLIIDQIHKFCEPDSGGSGDKALFALCDLFDATGIPMLWCGTIDMVEYLERGEGRGRQPLAQIRRRITICRDLHQRAVPDGHGSPGERLHSIDDIRRIFARNKLKLTSDAAKFLMLLANLPGGGSLGTATELVLMATVIYEADSAALASGLTADHLRAARGMMATRRTLDQAAERMLLEEQQSRPALREAVA